MKTILSTFLLPKQVIILQWYQNYLHNSIHASSFLPCPALPSSESFWAGRTIINMQTTWSLALGHRVIPCVGFTLHRLESLGTVHVCWVSLANVNSSCPGPSLWSHDVILLLLPMKQSVDTTTLYIHHASEWSRQHRHHFPLLPSPSSAPIEK